MGGNTVINNFDTFHTIAILNDNQTTVPNQINFESFFFHSPIASAKINELGSIIKYNKAFLNLFPEVYWVISPQSRFQIGYSIKYNWLKNFSHDYVLVTDNKDSQNDVFKNGWTSTISFKFLASLRLSSKSNNELFFRSCYNYMPKDPSQSYFQAQLGYSFNILDKNIESPPLKPFQGF